MAYSVPKHTTWHIDQNHKTQLVSFGVFVPRCNIFERSGLEDTGQWEDIVYHCNQYRFRPWSWNVLMYFEYLYACIYVIYYSFTLKILWVCEILLHVSDILLHANACWCRHEEVGIQCVHVFDIIRHTNVKCLPRVAETHQCLSPEYWTIAWLYHNQLRCIGRLEACSTNVSPQRERYG